MSNTYFDDRFNLLLDKYSPAILQDLIATFRPYGYTVVPQIDFEISPVGIVNFRVEADSLKNKITILFGLPLYDEYLIESIYQDALRTAPGLESSGLHEKNVAFLFLLTLAYKKISQEQTAIKHIVYEKISSGVTSSIKAKIIISKHHQYVISTYTLIKGDL